ncbi:hypothetical protein G6F68_021684 [Rhizopus microsporus]|nr:hypothetical protein G6F68_021684 [Rhizopus microsporus]
MAPKGTPPDIVKRMNADMVKVLSDPATAKGMIAAGAEPTPGTPEQFGEFVRDEIVKWRDLIKTANIKLE